MRPQEFELEIFIAFVDGSLEGHCPLVCNSTLTLCFAHVYLSCFLHFHAVNALQTGLCTFAEGHWRDAPFGVTRKKFIGPLRMRHMWRMHIRIAHFCGHILPKLLCPKNLPSQQSISSGCLYFAPQRVDTGLEVGHITSYMQAWESSC